MNGAGSFSNYSFNYENSWYGGRLRPSASRIDIENDLYRGNSSPNFLSACSSFLQLRLQERLGNDRLANSSSQFHVNTTASSNFESCSVLNFANSCIQLQNIENYSHHIENETSNSDGITLHIDEILPKPTMNESKSNILYAVLQKKLRNQFMKLKNIFKGSRVVLMKKNLEMKKSIKLVTRATQTDLCSRKFKHIKKPGSSTMLKGRSLRMSIPEEVQEYQSWKANFSNEMKKTKRHRIYKCPMAKCSSCLEVVETKVQTKKFTKMRRQSSKLSVLNEDREYDDEFEEYWRQVKLNNSTRF